MKEYTEWEYIKDCFQGIIDFIRWGELGALILLTTIGFMTLGWLGILLALLFYGATGQLQGGMVGDFFNEYPDEEPKRKKCSAGVENCRVCGDGYDHTFNVEYEKHLKWYEKIMN